MKDARYTEETRDQGFPLTFPAKSLFHHLFQVASI